MRNLFQKLADRLQAFKDRLSVRAQITAAVAAMVIALVGALATGAAFVSYRNTAELVNTRLASVASTTAERLDRYMALRQQEVHLFSKLEPMRPLWQGDHASLRKALEQLQSSFTDFAWIGFAKPDGTVVASTGGMLEGASVAQRPWFRTGLHDPIVGDVHEAALLSSLLAKRADGEPHRFVDIALPVRDTDGNLLGVLGAHLDWQWARNLIASAEANDGGTDTTLSVLSRAGAVLVGPGTTTTKYSGDRLGDILRTRTGAFTEKPADQNLLTAYYVSRGHRDYQGLNWIVTASQPSDVALAAAVHSAKTILVIGAIAGLVGVILAFFIARQIARPIHAITLEADRIGRASGPTMLPRQNGSLEVVQLTRALRSLLRRIGFAEERTKEAELRATENAMQFKDDLTKLRRLADTDYLTDLMNRRAFLAAADDAMEFAHRYKRNIATLMIDIDHFKKINDNHGHHVGDVAIKRIAEIISSNIKSTDRAARFGGEEFVVLLREADELTAQALANRIRNAIELAIIGEGETRISATVSIGIALIADSDRDVQDMIERADQGLYVAKNTGRNRCFFMPASEDRSIRAA
ncbi:sensor domain-containing diguanylate cyclase [Tardiphaga sp. 709]|uniref:sensor domain-containing diguanylate cyclase n=1 Tax=Tardiphaga sp. 709 TaxID=3076039 RepID=UPI0028E2E8F0|nr:sensor domain-containing diguanylate cyclase [Tardiphaga sp. 709]WNV08199.1 sensor domain-containing diguanylate cyclase [Tardiphaga sp. 709]